jgi:hypothetical protein
MQSTLGSPILHIGMTTEPVDGGVSADRPEPLQLVGDTAEVAALRGRHEAAKTTIAGLRQQTFELRNETAGLREALGHARRRIVELEDAMAGMHASRSWRMTRPVRWLGSAVRTVRHPKRLAGRAIRTPVYWAMRTILVHPRAKARALRIVSRFPNLEARLRAVGVRAGLLVVPSHVLTEEELSSRAAWILGEMRRTRGSSDG